MLKIFLLKSGSSKGSVLILSLLIMAILLTFGGTFLSLTLTNIFMQGIDNEVLKAEYIAKAGLVKTFYELRNYYFESENTYKEVEFGDGSYQVGIPTVKGSGIRGALVVCLGKYRNSKVGIVMELKASTFTDFLVFLDSPRASAKWNSDPAKNGYFLVGKTPDDVWYSTLIWGGPVHTNGLTTFVSGSNWNTGPWGEQKFDLIKPAGLRGPLLHTSEYIFHEAAYNPYNVPGAGGIHEQNIRFLEGTLNINGYSATVTPTGSSFSFIGEQGQVNYPEFELKWYDTVGLAQRLDDTADSGRLYPSYASYPATTFNGLLADSNHGGYYINMPKRADEDSQRAIRETYQALIDSSWHIKGTKVNNGRFTVTNSLGFPIKHFVNDVLKAKVQLGVGPGTYAYDPPDLVLMGIGNGIKKDFYFWNAVRGGYPAPQTGLNCAYKSHIWQKGIYVGGSKVNITDGYVDTGFGSPVMNSSVINSASPTPGTWQWAQVAPWTNGVYNAGLWFENAPPSNSEIFVSFTGLWRIGHQNENPSNLRTVFKFHPPRNRIEYFSYIPNTGEQANDDKVGPWISPASAVYNDADSTGGAGFTRTDPPSAGKWKWYDSTVSTTSAVISTDVNAKDVDTLVFGTPPQQYGWIYIDFDGNHNATFVRPNTIGSDCEYNPVPSIKQVAVAYGSDFTTDAINRTGGWWGPAADNSYPGAKVYLAGSGTGLGADSGNPADNNPANRADIIYLVFHPYYFRLLDVCVDQTKWGGQKVWSPFTYIDNSITLFKAPASGVKVEKERIDCVYEINDTASVNGLNSGDNVKGWNDTYPQYFWFEVPTWLDPTSGNTTNHLCPVKFMEVNRGSITVTDPQAAGRAICIDQIVDAVEIDLSSIDNFPKDPRDENKPGIIYSEVPLIVKGTPKKPVTIICLEDVYVKSINYQDNNNDGNDDRGYVADDPGLKPVGIISGGHIWLGLWYTDSNNRDYIGAYKVCNLGLNKVALYSQGSHLMYIGSGESDINNNVKIIGSIYSGSMYFGDNSQKDRYTIGKYTISYKGKGYRPAQDSMVVYSYPTSFRGGRNSTTGELQMPPPHIPLDIAKIRIKGVTPDVTENFLIKFKDAVSSNAEIERELVIKMIDEFEK